MVNRVTQLRIQQHGLHLPDLLPGPAGTAPGLAAPPTRVLRTPLTNLGLTYSLKTRPPYRSLRRPPETIGEPQSLITILKKASFLPLNADLEVA